MFNDGQLNIQNLSLSHAQQRLSVSGEYAQHRDGLLVNLRQFDVGYALSMIGLEDLIFGGRATGQATIRPSAQNELQVFCESRHSSFHLQPLTSRTRED